MDCGLSSRQSKIDNPKSFDLLQNLRHSPALVSRHRACLHNLDAVTDVTDPENHFVLPSSPPTSWAQSVYFPCGTAGDLSTAAGGGYLTPDDIVSADTRHIAFGLLRLLLPGILIQALLVKLVVGSQRGLQISFWRTARY